MRAWDRFEALVVKNMRVRWALIIINLGGAIYGFSWYFDQLAATNRVLWPVVPDSPFSALSFGVVLLLYTVGKRARPLEAVSYMMMMKYGLWAALVLIGHAAVFGNPTFELMHLTLSHIGMTLEAFLYLRHFHPGLSAGLFGAGWMIMNDIIDYTYMTHPSLPHPALLPAARWTALGLTVGVLIVYFIGTRAGQPAGISE